MINKNLNLLMKLLIPLLISAGLSCAQEENLKEQNQNDIKNHKANHETLMDSSNMKNDHKHNKIAKLIDNHKSVVGLGLYTPDKHIQVYFSFWKGNTPLAPVDKVGQVQAVLDNLPYCTFYSQRVHTDWKNSQLSSLVRLQLMLQYLI